MTLLEGLALLACGFWLLLSFDPRRRWPGDQTLPGPADASIGESVVVVVPARNEGLLLPRTLPALLEQPLPGLRVVLVDDDSTDGTARVAHEVAEAAGRADRLRVVKASPTPPGWSGKVWALACGVDAAIGADATASPQTSRAADGRFGERTTTALPDWLLFTDADIHHEKGTVAALLARAAGKLGGGPRDLVSVMARLRTETFWERLLVPAYVFFFQLLYPFRLVASDDSPVAAAAGGCVLVRRRALECAGGLAAIAGAVIDDVALARAVKGAGGQIWLGLDGRVRSLRTYPRLADVWRLVARTAFVQLDRRWSLLPPVLAGLALLVAAPPVVALVAGALAAAPVIAGLVADSAVTASLATASLARAVLWAALAWALEIHALLPAVRYHRLPSRWAFVLPAAGLLYGLMTAGSAWEHLRGRGARWKGRTYPHG